jgi:hypothetical protein
MDTGESRVKVQSRGRTGGGVRWALLAAGFTAMAVAQVNGPDVSRRLDALEKAARAAQMSGDNAWMLTCSALVLMMTAPGLALFYCGLVRRKNVLSTMMHGFALMGVVTILWAVAGYSLTFSEGSPFVGGLRYLFLHGVGADPNPDYAATIPQQTFMVYQLMFAIITPALICGAFAERMRFSAMLLFMTLWMFLVYFPMAHMVWGKGGFLNGTGGRFPAWDFAGGTVVHITSGVSALVCALYLGKRTGYPHESMRPHNLVLSVIGAGMLWVGWFGFNAGSALSAGPLATSAFVATQFGAAAAALAWLFVEWWVSGKPSVLGGTGGDHAGVGLRPADGGDLHRRGGGSGLLPDGEQGEAQVRLRRCARRLRSPRRRRDAGRAVDGRFRHQGGQRSAVGQGDGVGGRRWRPGGEPGDRGSDFVGAGDCRDAGYFEDLRCGAGGARGRQSGDRRAGFEHARRRWV